MMDCQKEWIDVTEDAKIQKRVIRPGESKFD